MTVLNFSNRSLHDIFDVQKVAPRESSTGFLAVYPETGDMLRVDETLPGVIGMFGFLKKI
jgi:hypothetical protein